MWLWTHPEQFADSEMGNTIVFRHAHGTWGTSYNWFHANLIFVTTLLKSLKLCPLKAYNTELRLTAKLRIPAV